MKLKQTYVKHKALKNINRIVDQNHLSAYTHFNKIF